MPNRDLNRKKITPYFLDLSGKPQSHVGILIYRTRPIEFPLYAEVMSAL